MPLTDTACRNAKGRDALYKLSDGGGLQLWVQPNGAKLWRLAYRFAGKQKLLAIGTYPVISLADARRARDDAKRTLTLGDDPSRLKQSLKTAQASGQTTFRTIAREYIDKLKREGRADATITKAEWFLTFADSLIGGMDINKIAPIDVLAVLRTVERGGRHETATRVRAFVGRVSRYAVATGRAENDPTLALRGALTAPVVKPRAAVTTPRAFGALLRAIDGLDGQPTTLAALQLMALLFPRPGELRLAEWPEFDLDCAVWAIPASRTKMRRPHRIPLSRQAITILKDLRKITGCGRLVFPCVRTIARPISENTLNAALRRLGYSKDQATAHGFRATASTLLNESGKWNADAIERQLAHVENNDVRRAYARGEHWDERTKMMTWWADYLDDLKIIGKVVPLEERHALKSAYINRDTSISDAC